MTTQALKKVDNAIQVGKFCISRTGLAASGSPTYQEWYQCGEVLYHLEGSIHWALGDWLNYGERAYGKMYAQAMESGYDYQTLNNDKWVAGKVEFSRRRENLTWAHHAEVASLEPEQQDEWLDSAEKNGWTRNDLREELASYKKDMKRKQLVASATGLSIPDFINLQLGDFRECMKTLEDNSVGLIFTDPPYDEQSIPLYGDLAREAARVLKLGGSLITYAGNYALPRIMADMSEHLRYWWIIALEHNGASARLPGKWVFVEWKPLLWFVKDKLSTNEYVSDLFKSEQPDKIEHDWQQHTSEAAYYIEHLTQPGDLVADPFLGSGTTLIAAQRLNRHGWGCELDADTLAVARARLAKESNE